ncbi:MAG: hypothetical protein OHK0057_25030 [Thermoflexibacter sp.]
MLINDENKTDIIDAYLDGRLSGADVQELENKLKIDSDLRAEVQAQKAVRKYLIQKGRAELKAKLKMFHKEMLATQQETTEAKEVFLTFPNKEEVAKNKPVIFSTNRKVNFAIAAAVIVLIISIFSILPPSGQKSETLIAEGKTYQIELRELGQKSEGFAGQEISVADSITLLIKESNKYTFHYQFTETLTIYSQYLDPNVSKILVEHDAEKNTYTLVVDDKRYPLERGFIDINPLKEEGK